MFTSNMRRVDAMTNLINHKRLSKTVISRNPTWELVRGIPIHVGADDPQNPEANPNKIFYGGSGLWGTGILANIPDAIIQTASDIEILKNEVYSAANFPVSDPTYNKQAGEYYINVIIPFIKDWNSFANKHGSGWSKLGDWFIASGLSTWHSINQYRERLLDIRKAAEAANFMQFKAPRPIGPNVDIIQQGLNKAAKAGQEIWDIAKIVIIIGAVAIGIGIIILILGKAPTLGLVAR